MSTVHVQSFGSSLIGLISLISDPISTTIGLRPVLPRFSLHTGLVVAETKDSPCITIHNALFPAVFLPVTFMLVVNCSRANALPYLTTYSSTSVIMKDGYPMHLVVDTLARQIGRVHDHGPSLKIELGYASGRAPGVICPLGKCHEETLRTGWRCVACTRRRNFEPRFWHQHFRGRKVVDGKMSRHRSCFLG